ncbi:12873_t:CDS:2, partial [Dentiscutata erythropus]
MARFPSVVKFFNIASYLLFATLVSEPEFRFEYHNTYIHPNVFVFYFWNLIHWILGFFRNYLVCQFIDVANETIVDGIGWLFVCSALLNSAWLVLLYKYPPLSRFDTFFIHLPFNIYHAWAIVICVISLFVAVVPDKDLDSESSPGVVTQICSVIALAFLDLVAMGYIYKCKGDLVGAGVIVITLLGIALQQEDIIVRWAALGLGIKTTILMANDYINKYCRIIEEQTPLL